MTPTILAKAAKSLAGGRVGVKVFEKRDAERLGMGAYLSVARGSMEPPKFIVVNYRGGKGAAVALIGKSITFDSGGISIKPSEGMEKMKYDMAGGAVVLGVVKAASEMRLPVNLVGILPATENLPGGSASKPGDIVSSLSGKTIEIVNTDAEGRMVLADGIGYVKKLKPRIIIDIATLTGACGVALGNEAIAMMGNESTVMEKLRTIGDEVYERVWQMPLYDEYLEYIKSDVAELKNSGGKTGSLVTAAYFLKEFAGDTPWVHLDIAGTAWTEKDKPYVPKGATGIGVRLLLNLLKEMK
jgi:leucyl aminopeptidase